MAVETAAATGNLETQKKNRIQVSNTKNLSSSTLILPRDIFNRTMRWSFVPWEWVTAITTVVTIAEILKNNGLATEKKLLTSTVNIKDENKGRVVQKAKIEIVLSKSDKFDSLMTVATTAPEAASKDKE